MKSTRVVLAAVALVAAVVGGNLLFSGDAASGPERPANNVLARALDIDRGVVKPAKYEAPLSAGTLYAVLQASGDLEARAEAAGPLSPVGPPPSLNRTTGCKNVFSGPVPNIRVNQDCSLRRQAEEVVVVNPTDRDNIIAGQNDSRLGFNRCGYDFTFNRARNWGDMVPPFYQELLTDGHTADACSDPTATFDSEGNAYVGGILFEVIGLANGIFVAKSNAPNGGAFYHSPFPGPFQEYLASPLGTVVNESDPDVFHDKEFIVADDNAGSPKADNVYATWTRFHFATGEGVGSHSPIFFSESTDGGATWSEGIEISGRSEEFCTDFSGSADPNACDQDQGSHPTVGDDGTIYVSFGNGNTPNPGENQVLFVWCEPTADCTDPASWNGPTRVGDLIGTHPIGDPGNAGGCPVGRQCLPPNGYRVPEFTSISNSSDSAGNIYVVWSDFRNGDDAGSTCGPLLDWSEATPPCNNDVFYAFSTDGGATWSETRPITEDREFGETAQWQPWSEVTAEGNRLMVAFYDRQYGDCETSGCNDITLTEVRNPRAASPTMLDRRITTGSMPNLVPANNPVQAGFLGDYMWVDVDGEDLVHVAWADTRPLFGTAPEEDIYYARVRARTPGS